MIAVPPSLLTLVLALTLVPESRVTGRPARFDVRGAVAATLALAALTYGLISAASRGWTDLSVIAALLTGAGSLVAFVRIETRSAAAMMPLGVFRSRTFSGANLLTLLLFNSASVSAAATSVAATRHVTGTPPRIFAPPATRSCGRSRQEKAGAGATWRIAWSKPASR